MISVPPSDALMCKPKFSESLSDLTIKDGEPLKLSCAVKGDPDPNITWSKNGEVFTHIAHNFFFLYCNLIGFLALQFIRC